MFGALKLVDAAESLSLVLGLPQLNLGLGLAESFEDVVLLLGFLVNLHPQVLRLSDEGLELGEESGTVTGLAISKLLGVLQLGAQRDLVLLERSDRILEDLYFHENHLYE